MSETEQFSLKWNNFHSNLTTGFQDFLVDEQFVDVTLTTEGKFIKAHKLILSVCSPYFRRIFKISPCKHPVVILTINYQYLKDILTFVYQGEVNVRQEDLSGFLKAAEVLQIKGLTPDECENNGDKDELSVGKKKESQLLNESNIPANGKKRHKSPIHQNDIKRPAFSSDLIQIKAEFDHSLLESSNDLEANVPKSTEDRNNLLEDARFKYEYDENLPIETSDVTFENNEFIPAENLLENVYNSNLTRENEQTNVENPIFQCNVCNKQFKRRDHLKTHHRNIHGEDKGPFSCRICSQLYKNSESLRKHVSRYHNFGDKNEKQVDSKCISTLGQNSLLKIVL